MPKLFRVAIAMGGVILVTAPPARSASFLDAYGHVERSLAVIDAAARDPTFANLLRQARGVLIVPHIGLGGPIIGFPRGEGLLVVKHDSVWSDPAFYHVGKITVTGWTGLNRRWVLTLLMSEKAIDAVTGYSRASPVGFTGLSIVDYGAESALALSDHDVIVWSNVRMANGNANIDVSALVEDRSENRAYYGRDVAVGEILGGVVWTPQSSVLGAKLHLVSSRSEG